MQRTNFLSKARLLDDKKFANQLYMEMNEKLPIIKHENIEYKPIVVDGNIITAVTDGLCRLSYYFARMRGYEYLYKLVVNYEASEDIYKYHLDDEGIKNFEEVFSDFFI